VCKGDKMERKIINNAVLGPGSTNIRLILDVMSILEQFPECCFAEEISEKVVDHINKFEDLRNQIIACCVEVKEIVLSLDLIGRRKSELFSMLRFGGKKGVMIIEGKLEYTNINNLKMLVKDEDVDIQKKLLMEVLKKKLEFIITIVGEEEEIYENIKEYLLPDISQKMIDNALHALKGWNKRVQVVLLDTFEKVLLSRKTLETLKKLVNTISI
jgi:hypothetical protein